MEVEKLKTAPEGSLLAGSARPGGVAGGLAGAPGVRVGVVELSHD